jgi:MarR family transcriptional regulator, organic hydroperoxide resistance regulator
MISRQSICRDAGRTACRASPEGAMPEFLDLHGRTSKALRALTETEMRRHGLHYGQDLVLAVLWQHDGSTPGEVAAALHVTTPTIVKMATRMTAAGLLTRRRDDRDNRLVHLWLTEAGQALKEPVLAARQSLEDKVTAGLTETELRCLLTTLATIHRAAAELLGEPPDPTTRAAAEAAT